MFTHATVENKHMGTLQLMRHPIRWVALIGLCSPFLHHAITRFFNFDFAISEMEQAYLLPAAPIAAAAIAIQLICAALILSGFLRWVGALALSILTIAWAVSAHPFWRMRHDLEQVAHSDAFMLQMAVAGGLLLMVWYDLHIWRTRGVD